MNATYLLFLAAVSTTPAVAVQKFNPYSGEFETTTPDAEIEYNPYDGSRTYIPHPHGNEPIQEFNPYTGEFELVPDTFEYPQEDEE